MKGFVANTDFDWFTFLAARQPLEEVNFWQPSGGDAFRALAPGEPFFFRLKSPRAARCTGGPGRLSPEELAPAQGPGGSETTSTPAASRSASGRRRRASCVFLSRGGLGMAGVTGSLAQRE